MSLFLSIFTLYTYIIFIITYLLKTALSSFWWRSISVLTLFWMMYMLLQLDNTVQYDFLSFPLLSLLLLLVFTASLLVKPVSIVGWEGLYTSPCGISPSKHYAVFQPANCHRLDPMFSTSHVLIILAEYLYQTAFWERI